MASFVKFKLKQVSARLRVILLAVGNVFEKQDSYSVGFLNRRRHISSDVLLIICGVNISNICFCMVVV